MPWWAEGCETTRKMVISYDNLIHRLWLHGAIEPYGDVETLMDEQGLPPVPHEFWVSRLGFQQTDPVTDFRSGGVLSLAMMVHIAESCPNVFARFVNQGDASVLPFGITSINITDMMAKFLMLAKSVDRMDALLSTKPFWRMFADPNALLACQELSLDMLADVVVELKAKRQYFDEPDVTVFDFSEILSVTDKRVQYDLLGAGPKTVEELRAVHARLKLKYQKELQQRLNISPDEEERVEARADSNAANKANEVRDQVFRRASGLASKTSSLAGGLFSKLKAPGFAPLSRSSVTVPATAASSVEPSAATTSTESTAPPSEDATPDTDTTPSSKPPANKEDDEWDQVQNATDAVSNFSIGDEDDDEDL